MKISYCSSKLLHFFYTYLYLIPLCSMDFFFSLKIVSEGVEAQMFCFPNKRTVLRVLFMSGAERVPGRIQNYDKYKTSTLVKGIYVIRTFFLIYPWDLMVFYKFKGSAVYLLFSFPMPFFNFHEAPFKSSSLQSIYAFNCITSVPAFSFVIFTHCSLQNKHLFIREISSLKYKTLMNLHR